ncbi:MAG: twin-arginine translocation signal domain-containing protein [Gemmatimonadaceae bacterium]
MSTSRRDFLKQGTALGGAIGFGLTGPDVVRLEPPTLDATTEPVPPKAEKPLRILILGGTGFIGPHQVRYAQARGHTLTLFNRGVTNPGLFPDIEKLQGDRAVGNYESLKGRDWDVVIDNPTTIPRWVRQAGEVLKGHTRQFMFVSTMSVYAKNDTPNADESADLATTTEPESEDARRLYGPLKALSEKEVARAFPEMHTIIRPGLIVGPGDLSDRFTYWPVRLSRGGEVLAPGTPQDPTQIIDARDLAEFMIRSVEENTLGTFNCTGPQSPLTIGEMLGGIRATQVTDARLTWVDAAFLAQQHVRPWSDMPVWIQPSGEYTGFMRRSTARALAKGLTFRPLAQTAKDTLDYYSAQSESDQVKLRAGLDATREKEVLAAWHAANP